MPSQRERAGLQVDIFPAQPERFTATQAEPERDQNKRLEAVAPRGLDKTVQVLAPRRLVSLSRHTRQLDELRDVAGDVAATERYRERGPQSDKRGLTSAHAYATALE